MFTLAKPFSKLCVPTNYRGFSTEGPDILHRWKYMEDFGVKRACTWKIRPSKARTLEASASLLKTKVKASENFPVLPQFEHSWKDALEVVANFKDAVQRTPLDSKSINFYGEASLGIKEEIRSELVENICRISYLGLVSAVKHDLFLKLRSQKQPNNIVPYTRYDLHLEIAGIVDKAYFSQGLLPTFSKDGGVEEVLDPEVRKNLCNAFLNLNVDWDSLSPFQQHESFAVKMPHMVDRRTTFYLKKPNPLINLLIDYKSEANSFYETEEQRTSRLQAQLLWYLAAASINLSYFLEVVQPFSVMGIVTDGSAWHFMVFELNTMDFSSDGPQDRKNILYLKTLSMEKSPEEILSQLNQYFTTGYMISLPTPKLQQFMQILPPQSIKQLPNCDVTNNNLL